MTTDSEVGSIDHGRVRVATLNAFGLREDWPARRAVMAAGFTQLGADLVAMQEIITRPDYDQLRDVLGSGYFVAHHGERESDGQGISIARPVAGQPGTGHA